MKKEPNATLHDLQQAKFCMRGMCTDKYTSYRKLKGQCKYGVEVENLLLVVQSQSLLQSLLSYN